MASPSGSSRALSRWAALKKPRCRPSSASVEVPLKVERSVSSNRGVSSVACKAKKRGDTATTSLVTRPRRDG
eukprot:6174606-Pleurochrysis_carterae.AAC.1